jgi:hypothetical protein
MSKVSLPFNIDEYSTTTTIALLQQIFLSNAEKIAYYRSNWTFSADFLRESEKKQ